VVDLFEEVEDELRNEQYKKLALKLAPWVVGGLVAGALVAAAAYGYIRYQDATAAKAAGTYAAALDTMRKGDQQGAYKALDDVSGSSKGYKTLALMLQASIRLDAGKTDEAVKLFDKAADTAPSGKNGLILADTARLKAAWAVLDDSPYAEVEKRLKPLTEDGRPLRGLAREALTIAMLNAGMTKDARAEATRLTVSPDASQGIAQRARLMISLIDSGSASQIPAVTKAAKTAVPPAPAQSMQITPEMIEKLRAQAAAQGGAAGAAPNGGDGQ
jgi:hypothetical protein